jgi:hypothetical protein
MKPHQFTALFALAHLPKKCLFALAMAELGCFRRKSMGEDTGSFVPRHRLLLVSIGKYIKKSGLKTYDATRYAWRVNPKRAANVELVLGCNKGVVEGVYVASKWLDASPGEATRKNFPELAAIATHKNQRWGFVGKEADETSQKIYLGKRVPDRLAIGQAGLRYFDDAASS